jgi:uncharacterized membrane protein
VRERTLRSVLYFAAGIGLIVSLFAAAEFLDSALGAVCSVNSFVSCGKVATSGLTTTLGVPDYLWGIGGFVLILVLAALAEQQPRDRRRAYALLSVTTLGVVLAGYLLYVELVEIHALCLVCATAYVLGGFAWVSAIALARGATRDLGDPDAETDEEP